MKVHIPDRSGVHTTIIMSSHFNLEEQAGGRIDERSAANSNGMPCTPLEGTNSIQSLCIR